MMVTVESWVAEELRFADLGDTRRHRQLIRIVTETEIKYCLTHFYKHSLRRACFLVGVIEEEYII